jgi:hypothetical protein
VRAVVIVAIVCAASPVVAKPKAKPKTKPVEKTDKSRFEAPADATSTPAYRYGSMSKPDCEAELGRRNIGFEAESAKGVLAPVRLTGRLHGVAFHTDDRSASRSKYEIGDCRLILAMDDLAGVLEQHGIVEVVHYSMYRPPDKGWPADKIGTRHNGALALDAARFIDKDGHALDVLKDFHGAIGAKTCGPGAGPSPVTENGTKIRELLCEIVGMHLFNVVLTPNYNRPHRNHFHLEVTQGVKWFLVH